MKKWFSFDPNGNGFILHDTAEEAKAQAERALSAERAAAISHGEWFEEVFMICWGKLHGQVIEENKLSATANNADGESTDFVLEDVKE